MSLVAVRPVAEPYGEEDGDGAVQLLLCAHAERRWLATQIAPLLEDLDLEDGVPGAGRAPALACLRVLWDEELSLAAHTEAAFLRLPAAAGAEGARGFHESVRALRGEVGRRVELHLRPQAQ
ncbi:MAG TPA: hypothetical protein VMA83_02055 [Solirubrobacteraceae bacterium]|nr:hypothetical protein [Solirubrobacteraceae bacterium]